MSGFGDMKLKTLIPIIDWLPNYKKENLDGDINAGITVGIMLIPQGMAYAILAGLEPIHGLYAVTIPLLLYAIFGTSRQLAVGPVAMVSLLTAAGIGTLQPQSPSEYLLLALTLAFLVGLIQSVMGLFRLGFLVNFLSHPVINGFTSAAAIIIGLSQIKHLLRINIPNSEHVQDIILSIVDKIHEVHLPTLAIGIVGIIIIKYGKKIHRTLPVQLIAVLVGILIVSIGGLNSAGVKILGEVPSGLPGISMPSFDLDIWSKLIPIALTISLVGFAESYAVAKAIQAKHKDYHLDPNQELIGLGFANFGAAFFQGYPVTGGFSRTAVNNQAGAKTALASIISVALIILTLLFFTKFFFYLPNAILAAVVIVAVAGLIDVSTPKQLYRHDRTDFYLLIVTFLITLTSGIETGIITGLILSLIALIYRASKPHIAKLGRIPGTRIFRNAARFPNVEQFENILIVRVDGPFYFANTQYIKEKIEKWIAESKAKIEHIVLDFSSVSSVDSSAIHEIEEWIKGWRAQNISLNITHIIGPVRDKLKSWGIFDRLGDNHIFLENQQAIEHLMEENISKEFKSYIFQTNDK